MSRVASGPAASAAGSAVATFEITNVISTRPASMRTVSPSRDSRNSAMAQPRRRRPRRVMSLGVDPQEVEIDLAGQAHRRVDEALDVVAHRPAPARHDAEDLRLI